MSENNVRGIEHIGITVPDVDEAAEFLARAFGATHVYDILTEPYSGREAEEVLGLPEGATILAARMIRLANGANIELFKYAGVEQRAPHRPSDFGLQHVAIMVDDIVEGSRRIVAAGGTALSEPRDLPGGAGGKGNYFAYFRAPWGSTIELIAFGSPEAYENGTDERCWRPDTI